MLETGTLIHTSRGGGRGASIRPATKIRTLRLGVGGSIRPASLIHMLGRGGGVPGVY